MQSKIMNNSNLNEKSEFFLLNIKISQTTYYQRDVILNRAKEQHEHDEKRLKKQARYKCRELSEEENNIKR